MDTELARTFLEVAATRHFGRAADNLHVTQSAVSARVRQLEELVGCLLFSRDRHNIRLTAAGHRLVPHATAILNAWNRARQDVALAEDSRALVSVAASALLWETAGRALLADWAKAFPAVCFAEELADSGSSSSRVADGSLDLALQFEPPRVPGLSTRRLATVELVMVCSQPVADMAAAFATGLVSVDWGADLVHRLSRACPPPPRARCRLSESARVLLGRIGGAAYLVAERVRDELEDGRLYEVPGAPRFTREIHGLFRDGSEQAAPLAELLGRPAGDG